MSSKEKDSKIFLCCFCGITIKTNRYNLDLHEKSHGQYISKIRCAAKDCDSLLANKRNYFNHWAKYHNQITMPDFLIYSDEPNHKKQAKLSSIRKAGSAKTAKGVEIVRSVIIGKAGEVRSDADRENDAPQCETPSDLLNFNIENIIQDRLLREPFYGVLSDLNHSGI